MSETKREDERVLELAREIGRRAWEIDGFRDQIRDSGHPAASALMEALDNNSVQIFASAQSIATRVLKEAKS